MSDLGLLLRKARMEQGITLEDLQETTKIRKRYLEAIEEGKYNVLPGNFYARAFIKQYSEAVGLDPDEVFRLYAHAIPSVEQEPSAEPIRMSRRRVSNPPERAGKWASALLMIAFPVLIIGVVYYYFFFNVEPRNPIVEDAPLTDQRASEQLSGRVGPEGESGGLTGVDKPQDNPSPGEPPVPAPKPEPSAEPNVTFAEKIKYGRNDVDRFEVKNAKEIQVEIQITGLESWVGISHADQKGKILFQKAFKQGETYSQAFTHNTYINIGLASAVELKVNGVPIDTGTEPDPRKYQFDLTET